MGFPLCYTHTHTHIYIYIYIYIVRQLIMSSIQNLYRLIPFIPRIYIWHHGKNCLMMDIINLSHWNQQVSGSALPPRTAPTHHLNKHWRIVNWAVTNQLRWNPILNTNISIPNWYSYQTDSSGECPYRTCTKLIWNNLEQYICCISHGVGASAAMVLTSASDKYMK